MRLLFNETPGALWTIDRQLRLTAVIGRDAGIFGVPPENLVGTTIWAFVGTDDPSNPAIAHHLAALAGQSASFRYPLKDSVYQVKLEPLHDGSGHVVGAIGVALNVTETQRAEDELAKSQARLMEAQALAHVGSWEWTMRENRVVWSDELYRIYGLDPKAFGGTLESYLALVHPDDLEHTKATLFEALQKSGSFQYSHRILRPDGELRILESRGEVVGSESGDRVVGSCWDVTDQWTAKTELEHTASALKATLEAMADGLLVVDRQRRFVLYNQRFLSLWAISERIAKSADADELRERVTSQLDDPEGFLRRINELYATPAVDSFDVIRFKDGRVFETQSIPQRIDPEIVGRVWSFHDVTDRERVLREAQFLADSGRLLASLDVEKALEGVARLAVPFMGDGCAVDLLTEVGGARRLLVIQRDPDVAMRGDIPRAVWAGRPLIYSTASISYMSLPLPGRSTLYGVLTFAAGQQRKYGTRDLDLAEELAARISLAIENAHLYQGAQDALRVREEFLSIAAHEIRGPITSIHLAVQTLRRSPSNAPVGKLLDAIEREDKQLIRLVDELLDVSRIRSGRIHFDLEEVDLAEVVRDVVARLTPDLSRSGCTLSLSTPGQLVGMWDRMRVDQVVTNLVSNAIKFGQGKPIEVSLAGDAEQITLVVRDHGIGIDAGMQERIFDPFARAVSARHYGGLGLGLYIVRTIVDGQGGSVRAEAAPGGGSVFTVELPRASAA